MAEGAGEVLQHHKYKNRPPRLSKTSPSVAMVAISVKFQVLGSDAGRGLPVLESTGIGDDQEVIELEEAARIGWEEADPGSMDELELPKDDEEELELLDEWSGVPGHLHRPTPSSGTFKPQFLASVCHSYKDIWLLQTSFISFPEDVMPPIIYR